MRQRVSQSISQAVSRSVSQLANRVQKKPTLVFKEVELHPQQAHGFAEGVRRRTLLLWTELQDL